MAVRAGLGFLAPLTAVLAAHAFLGNFASIDAFSSSYRIAAAHAADASSRIATVASVAASEANIQVGFNDLFLVGAALAHGFRASDMPNNSQTIPLSVAKEHLDYLAAHGVTVHREIVAGRILADENQYPVMGDVVKEFAAHHMTLIIAVGRPVPLQSSTQDSACILPMGEDDSAAGDAEWNARAAQIAALSAKFLSYLKTRRDIDQAWLAGHVIAEPFNEFDAIGKRKQAGAPCDPADNSSGDYGHGTPKRAASLYRAFQTAFEAKGLTNEVTAPSIVGVFYGHLTRPEFGIGAYLYDYYNVYNGGGRANVHIYPGDTAADSANGAAIAERIERAFTTMTSGIPARYASTVILGETGIPLLTASCGTSMGAATDAARAAAYGALLHSPAINSRANMMLIWRLLPDYIQSPTACSWAMVPTAAWQHASYDAAGNKIFSELAPSDADTVNDTAPRADTAVLRAEPVSGAAPLHVTFSVRNAGGATLVFGDGERTAISTVRTSCGVGVAGCAHTVTLSHTYMHAGTFTAQLVALESGDQITGGKSPAYQAILRAANQAIETTIASVVIRVNGDTVPSDHAASSGSMDRDNADATTIGSVNTRIVSHAATFVDLTPAEQAQLLYYAYLNRWGSEAEVTGGAAQIRRGGVAAYARFLGLSDEGKKSNPIFAYPDIATPSVFLNKIYLLLFNRAPESDGREYWLAEIDRRLHNPPALAQIILDVISGANARDMATLLSKLGPLSVRSSAAPLSAPTSAHAPLGAFGTGSTFSSDTNAASLPSGGQERRASGAFGAVAQRIGSFIANIFGPFVGSSGN